MCWEGQHQPSELLRWSRFPREMLKKRWLLPNSSYVRLWIRRRTWIRARKPSEWMWLTGEGLREWADWRKSGQESQKDKHPRREDGVLVGGAGTSSWQTHPAVRGQGGQNHPIISRHGVLQINDCRKCSSFNLNLRNFKLNLHPHLQ